MTKEFDTLLLGQIPLVMEAGEAAERGLSVFSLSNKPIIDAFENITEQLVSRVESIAF
ncbi:MAG TPA: hypothetical protein VHO50_14150 [Bacteroidales bacterium]|nr:hypothetical protein [Bacteroidales bacterium]